MTQRKKAKNRVNRKFFTTVSFFCGCGGLDLGFVGGFDYLGKRFKKLPFKILAGYDYDEKCLQTYAANISQHVESVDLANHDQNSTPKAEVLIGGFPCQDFATCGPRKGIKSNRGRLYKALVSYMRLHRPMVVVGENVPGLENINGGRDLDAVISDLGDAGYQMEKWKLYAPDFGVPQRRTRLFIVGVRKDIPGFPHSPRPAFVGKHRSIKWAIQDLENILDESVPNQSQFFRATKAKRGNGQGDEKSNENKPGYTVRANAKSRVQFHYAFDRRLTVRECARLQTFPDSFVFPHSATTNILQIGNAVPPILAYSVGRSIANFLETIHGEERDG